MHLCGNSVPSMHLVQFGPPRHLGRGKHLFYLNLLSQSLQAGCLCCPINLHRCTVLTHLSASYLSTGALMAPFTSKYLIDSPHFIFMVCSTFPYPIISLHFTHPAFEKFSMLCQVSFLTYPYLLGPAGSPSFS